TDRLDFIGACEESLSRVFPFRNREFPSGIREFLSGIPDFSSGMREFLSVNRQILPENREFLFGNRQIPFRNRRLPQRIAAPLDWCSSFPILRSEIPTGNCVGASVHRQDLASRWGDPAPEATLTL